MRGFLIAYSIWVLNYLRRAQHYRSYDKALFFWSLFLILVMLYIDSTRSKSFVMHLAPTLVVVFVFLLIIPNRLPSQIFLTLLVFTGESLIMAPKIRLSETLPLAFSILTASAMGIVSAWELHSSRRREFLAREGERKLLAEHMRIGTELRASRKFLEIASLGGDIQDMLQDFVGELKTFTGCDAVGVRLLDESGGIPYMAYQGFSREFYETESPLSIKTDQCMCINVVKGVTNPELPFYSEGGSFYMNGTTRFLATVSEGDKGQTRNVCNLAGYESVALIPISDGSRIIGLIHLADHKEGMVPSGLVRFLEREALTLGIGVQRALAETSMRKNEAMLQAVLDQMPSGVTIRDAQSGTLVVANARSREVLESLVKTPEDFTHYQGFHPDGRPYTAEEWPIIRSMTSGEEVDAEEIECKRIDGSRYVLSVSSAPVRDAQSRIMSGVSVFHDITRRKLAEEARERLVSELETANRALDSFSYTVSHDLRAPLRAIDGFTRMLTRDISGQLDDEGKRKFGMIRENAQKMGRLIDDLLAFSRLGRQNLSLSFFDIGDLVNQIWEECRIVNDGRTMNLTIGELPHAYGDSGLVKQALANLIGNAVKFTRLREVAQIEIGGRMDGHENIYFVKDNGVGFDMKYYDKLFGVFQRLHSEEDFEGTGVGLAIVQRIIHRHGCRVWAEGKEGEGAAFYFTLPHP